MAKRTISAKVADYLEDCELIIAERIDRHEDFEVVTAKNLLESVGAKSIKSTLDMVLLHLAADKVGCSVDLGPIVVEKNELLFYLCRKKDK